MKTICILINGISLPYHVIDYAIEKAKKNSSEIFAIFLKGEHESPKGYGYPSDLGTTETWTSDEEAVKSAERIISNNMKLVKELIKNKKITYRSVLKTDATADDIANMTATADLIVVDENFDDMYLLNDDKISLKDLMKNISVSIHPVRQERSANS